PDATATFHGLKAGTTRIGMYRAVMEGASFALTRIFEQVVRQVGDPVSIGVTGGGANSAVSVQMLADLTGHPLALTDGASEGRGAALFCSVATGNHTTLDEATAAMIRTREVTPSERTSDWAAARSRWEAVYDAVGHLAPS
ncbi:MAG: hypothetical protein HUJ31_06720, partial [Pseudomonadales bacterium]|nr:hypothetical protein [Pseudomonadales bacterium]